MCVCVCDRERGAHACTHSWQPSILDRVLYGYLAHEGLWAVRPHQKHTAPKAKDLFEHGRKLWMAVLQQVASDLGKPAMGVAFVSRILLNFCKSPQTHTDTHTHRHTHAHTHTHARTHTHAHTRISPALICHASSPVALLLSMAASSRGGKGQAP